MMKASGKTAEIEKDMGMQQSVQCFKILLITQGLTHTHTHIHTHIHTHTHTHTHTKTSYTHIQTDTDILAHAHAQHTYTYTYTQRQITHTHTQSNVKHMHAHVLADVLSFFLHSEFNSNTHQGKILHITCAGVFLILRIVMG